jgi:hypothetical protein
MERNDDVDEDLCNGNLSVLVNGYSMEQVNISRGLKHGDPLALFLFIILAEDLSSLVQKAAGLGFSKVSK